MRTAIVIANPFAGTSRGRLSGVDAVERLRAMGLEAGLRPTTGPGHASQLAAEAARQCDVVVAVGGDGTIHEVAAGLVGTDCALGVLPTGSGNDFAVGLGCGTIEAGLAAIVSGRVLTIDVCALDEEPFVNSLGLLASGVISNTAARLWRWLGKFRYVAASLYAIIAYHGQPVSWRLEIAGDEAAKEQSGRFLLAEFCNGPLTGGGFRLVAGADFSDGLMDLCLVRPIGLIDGLKILPGAAGGNPIVHPAFERCRTHRVEFESTEPVAFHLDGEASVLPAGRHVVQVLESKLRVMVPA